MIDYFETICFALSLLLPVILFFVIGLGISWVIWGRSLKDVSKAFSRGRRLTKRLEGHYIHLHQSYLNYYSSLKDRDAQWKNILKKRENRIEELEGDQGLSSDDQVIKLRQKVQVEREKHLKELNLYKEEKEKELKSQQERIAELENKEGQVKEGNSKELSKIQEEANSYKQEKEQEIKSLKEKISKLEASQETVGKKDEKEIKTLQERITQLETAREEASNKAEELNKLNAEASSQKDEKEQEVKTLKERIALLEATQRNSEDGSVKELSRIQEEASAYRRGKEEEVKTLQERITQLETACEEANNKAEELNKLNAETSSEKQEKEQEVKTLQEQVVQLELARQEADSLKQENEEEVRKLQEHIVRLEETHREDNNNITQELSQVREEVALYKEEKEGEIKQLQEQAANAELSKQAEQEKQKLIDELQGQLQEQNEQRYNFIEEGNQFRQKISELEGELEIEKNKAPTNVNGFIALSPHTFREDERLGVLYNESPEAKDDLEEISGVAETISEKLNNFGVYTYKQIALWDDDNIEAFSEQLNFKGRIEREQWIAQALDLHYKKHGERLIPNTSLYYKEPVQPQTSERQVYFTLQGEEVTKDEALGILYSGEPKEVDDLELIVGISPEVRQELNSLGVYQYQQIALWDAGAIQACADKLAREVQIEEEEWVAQAQALYQELYDA